MKLLMFIRNTWYVDLCKRVSKKCCNWFGNTFCFLDWKYKGWLSHVVLTLTFHYCYSIKKKNLLILMFVWGCVGGGRRGCGWGVVSFLSFVSDSVLFFVFVLWPSRIVYILFSRIKRDMNWWDKWKWKQIKSESLLL